MTQVFILAVSDNDKCHSRNRSIGVTCDLFRQVMQCFANNAKRNLFSINGNGKNEETEIKRNSFYFYNEHDNI